MTETPATFDAIRQQVIEMLDVETRTPTGIKLGPAQREALEAHVRESSGRADVGPIVSFHGLAVVAVDTDGAELSWDEAAALPVASEPLPPAVFPFIGEPEAPSAG